MDLEMKLVNKFPAPNSYSNKGSAAAKQASQVKVSAGQEVGKMPGKQALAPQDRVELSQAAQNKIQARQQTQATSDSREQLKEKLDQSLKSAEQKIDSGAEKLAQQDLSKKILSSPMPMPTSLGAPSDPKLAEAKLEGTEQPINETEKVAANKTTSSIKAPGVFFIKGFGMNPFSSAGTTLEQMAGNFPGSKIYEHNQASEIIEAIKRRPLDQPIILVGHGFGGDTAVEVGQELNTLEHGFRPIDLLVTLDSVGFDNDIIPPNIIQNLNFIKDSAGLFNDGPHIARDSSRTRVDNELVVDDSKDLPEQSSVQMKIMERMREIIGPERLFKMQEHQRLKSLNAQADS